MLMTDKNYKPEHAFILAAGKGTRLRPYTDNTPKPMVPINGRPLIDYTLEKLKNEGVKHVTINTYYLGDRIINYIKNYQGLNITISQEDELLETGGGVKKALHTMKNMPFYLINGDALWTDRDVTALSHLAHHWDPETTDILLLLKDKNDMSLTHGIGDYDIKDDGLAVRAKNKDGKFMFGGIRIVSPYIFDNTPDSAFSFLDLMDKAEQKGRLRAIIHDGDWHHISTPKDLENINKAFANQETKAVKA